MLDIIIKLDILVRLTSDFNNHLSPHENSIIKKNENKENTSKYGRLGQNP